MTAHNNATPTESADYRHSHLERGGAYDATLAASPFDAYMDQWEAHWTTLIARRLHQRGIPRYLDFACGTGRITSLVSPLAGESIGVDVSESMLQAARLKCPEVRFIKADLTQERVDLGVFDVITAFRFFGNAQDDLRVAALAEIGRLLRSGGQLIMNNHRNPRSLSALLHRATGGDYGMDLDYFKLKRLLLASGFKVVEVHPIGFWLFRSRMQSNSRILATSGRMERLFGARVYAPLAPDIVVVARKA